MSKRVLIGLLALSVVVPLSTAVNMAEACHIRKTVFTGGIASTYCLGSLQCHVLGKGLGNTQKIPTFFSCEARGDFSNSNVQLVGIPECGNPGSKSHQSAGVNAFPVESIQGVTQVTRVDRNGNAIEDVFPTADQAALDAICEVAAPNPSWVGVDFTPCGNTSSPSFPPTFQAQVAAFTDEGGITEIVAGPKRYQCTLPNGLTCNDIFAAIEAQVDLETLGDLDCNEIPIP